MTNKLHIKVCGMRNPQNIKDIATLGVDYLGFIFFEKSPRNITDTAPISAPIAGIKKIGVFVNAGSDFICNKAKAMNLWGLQLHGKELPEQCKELKSQGYTIIKAFGVDDDFDFAQLEAYENCCDYFLFDTKSKKHGGTGVKFNWDVLRKYNNKLPIFLSGGITENDAEHIKALNWLNIHALDLNSKFEIEPALKDAEKLKGFLRKLDI